MHYTLLSEVKPINFEEAIHDSKWISTMKEELASKEKNQTWELVTLPEKKKPIAVKWVYKVKVNPNGEAMKYKARLVAKGSLQRLGIDYGELFAPVVRLKTMRIVVAIANLKDWSMHQLDVKLTFLNGPLDEEVFVLQPLEFMVTGQEKKVNKLRRALYGLKQAPRSYNKWIDNWTWCLCEVHHK